MKLRELLDDLDRTGDLVRVKEPVDPDREMAGVIHALEEEPVLFENVVGSDRRVFAGICADRDIYARALEVDRGDLVDAMRDALNHPEAPTRVDDGPCREVVEESVDLGSIPILKHFDDDAGPYATAAIVVVDDPDHGINLSYHRLLPIADDAFTGRFVEQRGTDSVWRRADGPVDVAVLLGSSVNVLLAAAISPPPDISELGIAQRLEATDVVETADGLPVPAETEIVLEGRLLQQQHDEGPFIDLTETPDIVRQQPVLKVDRVTRREDAMYQALLSGGKEHKLLMGMPREVTIRDEVAKVCDVRDVCLTEGGGSWLHAVVVIDKGSEDDPSEAIDAAFRGHSSLKSVVVVDPDIDPYDPIEVEWALATRYQADTDLEIFEDRPSSSLDPSARHVPGEKSRTTKTGYDATIPLGADREHFRKLRYEEVDVDRYLE